MCKQKGPAPLKKSFEIRKLVCSNFSKMKPNFSKIKSPYFPVFGLNTMIYSVNLRTLSEYWKICIWTE